MLPKTRMLLMLGAITSAAAAAMLFCGGDTDEKTTTTTTSVVVAAPAGKATLPASSEHRAVTLPSTSPEPAMYENTPAPIDSINRAPAPAPRAPQPPCTSCPPTNQPDPEGVAP